MNLSIHHNHCIFHISYLLHAYILIINLSNGLLISSTQSLNPFPSQEGHDLLIGQLIHICCLSRSYISYEHLSHIFNLTNLFLLSQMGHFSFFFLAIIHLFNRAPYIIHPIPKSFTITIFTGG